MRNRLVAVLLLLCFAAVQSDAAVIVRREAGGGEPSVWLENDAAHTVGVAVPTDAAHGQRCSIASNFTLNKVIIYIGTVTGSPTWECRIGKTIDLTTTYDEAWTGLSPETDSPLELVSVENPQYLTSDSVLYLGCIETAGGADVGRLSYSGDELTASGTKRVYRSTGDPWNVNYVDSTRDLRFEIWQE